MATNRLSGFNFFIGWNMSFTSEKLLSDMLESDLTLEGRDLSLGGNSAVYVVLTNTGTTFSKLSKMITKDPYNHVSISLDEDMSDMFTFALFNENGYSGGFKREVKSKLRGAKYSMYAIELTSDIKQRIVNHIRDLENNVDKTRYGHKSLVNILFNKKVFDTGRDELICSHFVATIFEDVGIKLFKNKELSMLKPYEFVKSKLLKFVRRGVIR